MKKDKSSPYHRQLERQIVTLSLLIKELQKRNSDLIDIIKDDNAVIAGLLKQLGEE